MKSASTRSVPPSAWRRPICTLSGKFLKALGLALEPGLDMRIARQPLAQLCFENRLAEGAAPRMAIGLGQRLDGQEALAIGAVIFRPVARNDFRAQPIEEAHCLDHRNDSSSIETARGSPTVGIGFDEKCADARLAKQVRQHEAGRAGLR